MTSDQRASGISSCSDEGNCGGSKVRQVLHDSRSRVKLEVEVVGASVGLKSHKDGDDVCKSGQAKYQNGC